MVVKLTDLDPAGARFQSVEFSYPISAFGAVSADHLRAERLRLHLWSRLRVPGTDVLCADKVLAR